MNLEYAIHSRWNNTSSLQNQMPVKYLVSGVNPYNHLPRGTLLIDDFSVSARTNLGVAGKKMTVKFTLSDDNYQRVSDLVDKIIETYDGVQFENSESRSLVTMKHSCSEINQTESLWTAIVHFETRIIYC